MANIKERTKKSRQEMIAKMIDGHVLTDDSMTINQKIAHIYYKNPALSIPDIAHVFDLANSTVYRRVDEIKKSAGLSKNFQGKIQEAVKDIQLEALKKLPSCIEAKQTEDLEVNLSVRLQAIKFVLAPLFEGTQEDEGELIITSEIDRAGTITQRVTRKTPNAAKTVEEEDVIEVEIGDQGESD